MSWPAIALLITAVLAAVAVTAALVALQAVRKLRDLDSPASGRDPQRWPPASALDHREVAVVSEPLGGRVGDSPWGHPLHEVHGGVPRPQELRPRVVEGRVIVPPTQAQVVRTALGRPGVRLNVLVFGLRHALRAENRDRIVSLMRREYRYRRAERMRAARHATRTAQPGSAPTTDRLHAHLAEPRPKSLAERMML